MIHRNRGHSNIFGWKQPEYTCPIGPRYCSNSRYRSIDGSCNNLQNPTWGMAETPYGRLTKYNYADGKLSFDNFPKLLSQTYS